MRVILLPLFVAGLTTAAHADRQAADECAKSLPANAKYIYETTQASHPTEQTGRSIVIGIVEKMIAEGKLTLSEGETAGEAAGTCLEKMK
ncbi:MAG: hypothetical protein ACOZAM_29825 [Pseudomonadota bacterium]